MLDGLAVALGATQQHTVLAGWPLQGQLVEGHSLAASLHGSVGVQAIGAMRAWLEMKRTHAVRGASRPQPPVHPPPGMDSQPASALWPSSTQQASLLCCERSCGYYCAGRPEWTCASASASSCVQPVRVSA